MPTDISGLQAEARDGRLKTLLNYLASDPHNSALLSDAAEQALDACEPEIAAALLGGVETLDEQQLNLAGLAALQLKDHARAAQCFTELRARGVDEPAVAFNLAWALAMDRKADDAIALLEDSVVEAEPQAATLKTQLLHDEGRLDAALEAGRLGLRFHAGDRALNAAVSVLAIDTDQPELAELTARNAGNHPEARASLGTLALRDNRVDEALGLFDEAIAANQTVARAWIGRGLARLMRKEADEASTDLDRGAELFVDHAGSWVTAGWAHLMNGDTAAARERFARAAEADPEDNEGLGGLAVVAALDGDAIGAAEKLEAARALGGESLSAGLAEALIASADGDPATAKALMTKILEAPFEGDGHGMAAALAKLSLH